jgi:signal transduction histidine kinase
MDDKALINLLSLSHHNRPRFTLFSFVVRNYSRIQWGIIFLILVLSASFYAPVWIASTLILYGGYYFVKRAAQKRKSFLGIPYESEQSYFLRAIFLIFGVFVFLLVLYRYTDYLTSGSSDTLWLLFLLPTFILSRGGMTRFMGITVIALACMALVVVTALSVPVPDWNLSVVTGLLAKIIWICFLAFLIDIFIQYGKDWHESFRYFGNIEENIMNIRSIGEEQKLIQKMVERISAEFGYPHVNLFRLSEGVLRNIASSDPAGSSLISAGFGLETSKGIIGHVARKGEMYFTNDVEKDPFFYKHPAFPKTQSELAAPIRVKGELVGVLDIQAHKKDAFFNNDIEIMETLSRHLGVIFDNFQLYESSQRIAHITESIAHRFLSQYELKQTLDDIAEAAYQEFKADFVVLYERNPETHDVTASAHKGMLFHPKGYDPSPSRPDGLVYRLLSRNEDYFDETIDSTVDRANFRDAEANGKPFVEREGICSRVIIQLRTDLGAVGLLFVNFRSPRTFDEPERNKFYIFAHLAAMSLQKSRIHLRQLQAERDELASDLHDRIRATANGASRIISTLLKTEGLDDRLYESLGHASNALTEMQADLSYLNNTLKDAPSGDLHEEIRKVKRNTESAYGINFVVNLKDLCQVPPAIAYQIRPVFNELILNAVNHGEAKEIDVDVNCSEKQIVFLIKDNGKGFDTKRVSTGGLQNIRNRIAKLGGNCLIESKIGIGSQIRISLPIVQSFE